MKVIATWHSTFWVDPRVAADLDHASGSSDSNVDRVVGAGPVLFPNIKSNSANCVLILVGGRKSIKAALHEIGNVEFRAQNANDDLYAWAHRTSGAAINAAASEGKAIYNIASSPFRYLKADLQRAKEDVAQLDFIGDRSRPAEWKDVGIKKVPATIARAFHHIGLTPSIFPAIPSSVAQSAKSNWDKRKNRTVVQIYASPHAIKGSSDVFLCGSGGNGTTAGAIAGKLAQAFQNL